MNQLVNKQSKCFVISSSSENLLFNNYCSYYSFYVKVTVCFIQGKRGLEEGIKDMKSVSDSLQKELATCKADNHKQYTLPVAEMYLKAS